MNGEEYPLFRDMRQVVRDGAIANQQQRERLAAIFAPEPEPAEDEATLDELADVVAERIVEKLTAEPEPEPQAAGGGFDGGARRSLPPPPESHGQWLSRVLRDRRADVGADL